MKKTICSVVAAVMTFCSINISTLAETSTTSPTINVTSKTFSGNKVTIAGNASGVTSPLEILVSKDGKKVSGGDITTDSTGNFTYYFNAPASGNYEYVISEKASQIAPESVLAEDFATVPTKGTNGAWVTTNLSIVSDKTEFGTNKNVLKLTSGRYLYDINGNGASYGNPVAGTTYSVGANVLVDGTSKVDMLLFRTVNDNANTDKGYEDSINQAGKSYAYQVRTAGTDIILYYADNNKSQTSESEKKAVLIPGYELGRVYNIKVEFDLDTLELKAYVDGAQVLTDQEMYIFCQSPVGYRRLFEADNQNMSNSLYIGDLALNKYTKTYTTGTVAYNTPEDIQAAVDYVKTATSADDFRTKITEKKDILGIDDTKAFYSDTTVRGSVYTDVKANATDITALKEILDKAEVLYNLKDYVESGDLTNVENLLKDYGYSIVYKACSPDTQNALNTAATEYTFSDTETVDANINGWISTMNTAYATAVSKEGVVTVTYDAAYSASDNGIKVTGTVNTTSEVQLKAVAKANGETVGSVDITTSGSFDSVIPVTAGTAKEYTVSIEPATSGKTTVYKSTFDTVPTTSETNVSTASNLSIVDGALKLGGATDKSRFIISHNYTTGIVTAEAKIKKADKTAVTKIFSLGTSGSSLPFALGADGSGNFILKYTSTDKTSGHLDQSINLGAYDTTKWYTIGYKLNLETKVVVVFFEGEPVLSLKLATHQQTLPRVLDAEVSTSQGVAYMDDFKCYYDNGLHLNAEEKTVYTETYIDSFDGSKAVIKSPEAKKAALIFATYDDDRLKNVQIISDFQINKGITERETSVNKDGADEIRVFLWKDMSAITPLCEDMSTAIN